MTTDDLTASTLQPARGRGGRQIPRVPSLTVLHHADRARVGEVVRLVDLLSGREVSLSRATPEFASVAGAKARPLADPWLSRKPVTFRPLPAGAVQLDTGEAPIKIDGAAARGVHVFGPDQLDAGVVLELSARVVLLLHRLKPPGPVQPRLDMVGASEPLERLRGDILKVVDLETPVLIRGESGTGKELVARALHQQGPRKNGPFVAVNMATLPPSTAAAELFGHVAGAFTGAVRSRAGHFMAAQGGTLFLDEIADVPAEVQAMLLRALETREVQALGGSKVEKVDVRLVAATDADLEELISSGKFREPLFHRLAGYQLQLPPLRQRRDDLGRLLHHFLEEEMKVVGELARLDRPLRDERQWLPAHVVSQWALHDWPGNVRQLRNAVRQLVISSRGLDEARVDEPLAESLERIPEAPPATAPSSGTKEELTEERVLATLRQHAWKTSTAAQALGISRTTLYALIDRSSVIRKAAAVPKEEIVAALAATGGDVEAAAAKLEVSKRGLQLRLRDEGLT